MPWMTVTFVALVSVGLAAIPAALVVAADRQPWPVQVRMLLAAHHSQLAFGAVALGVMDATVVDVAPGARPEWVVVCTRAQRRERLRLADGPDAQLLRYWQAEAIPVLLLQRDPAMRSRCTVRLASWRSGLSRRLTARARAPGAPRRRLETAGYGAGLVARRAGQCDGQLT